MSWNLCITTVFARIITKSIWVNHKHPTLNSLRGKLHHDAELRQRSGESAFNKLALRELKILQTWFYMTMILFIPTWIFSRYFVHHDLPIPIEVPPFIDLSDNTSYIAAFILFGIAAVIGLTVACEMQLAMYGVLIQISREYRVLVDDIPKLDELYAESNAYITEGKAWKKQMMWEVNPCLRKAQTKQLLKQLSNRLQQLIEYTQAFEFCYSASFLVEVFGTTVLIITLAYQTLMRSNDLSGDFFFLTGYLSIAVVDLFFTCMYATRIQTQCFEVGIAAYSTKWYRMSTDIQKDISFLILRSQNPPKITVAKFLKLNLTFFMLRMGNIFSSLTMIRQLEFKVQNDILPE